MYIPKVKNLHLVGIGGSGMSGIAEVLINMGYRVSGSDIAESSGIERLRVLGAEISIGHAEKNVAGAQVVIASSAISSVNPEVAAAEAAQIPVIPRAEMLAELMRIKYSVGVAGAHGKTTTTSMVTAVMAGAGLDPTAVVGGRLATSGSNACLGQGEFLVAEADESDGSFLHLSPTWAIVTNIDREHLDFYGDLEKIREAFVEFANKVPFYGAVFACVDSAPVRDILPRLKRRVITYGLTEKADVEATDLRHEGNGSTFNVRYRGEHVGEFRINTPGVHNVSNALAAIAFGLEIDLPVEKMRGAFATFKNTARRFEQKCEKGGVMVVDDYGHHPTEIAATLSAARKGWDRRVIAVFQPHRYTRTRDLAEEFDSAFDLADILVLTGIYAAGEDPIPGVTSESLFSRLKEKAACEVLFVPKREDIALSLAEMTRPGDICITLGAGDIWKTSEELCRLLEGGAGS